MSLHPPTVLTPLDVSQASPSQSNGDPRTAELANGPHQLSDILTEPRRPIDETAEMGLPSAFRRRPQMGWIIGVAAGFILLALIGTAWYTWGAFDDPHKDLQVEAAERGKIMLSIVEKGELEAARNTDVICQVRSSGRGNSIASSIKWLVDDGTNVKKGDILVRLDDSGLKEQLNSQESVVAEKHSSLTQAEKEKEITESQNQSDLQTARNNVDLARIDYEKFIKGDFEQKRKDVEGRITLAESDLLQWKDKVAWSSRMVKKGYISTSQAQADEAKLQSAEIGLEKLREEKRVLDEFERKRTILDLQNKLSQAETALTVAEIQSKGKEAQADAKLQAALSVLKQEQAKLQDLISDIRNCTIRAPNDGMVVYYVPESSRYSFSSSSSQGIIAVGEPVREGQRLMRIPELKHMQVKVKIHESLVPRLRGDKTKRTGFGERLYGALATSLPGPTLLTTLIAAPEIRRQFEDEEEEIVEWGLPAKIKIASIEQPLDGHVKSVSAVASSTDWMSSDVKVYPTIVVIDTDLEGLKPGMSAEVTVLVDELDEVLRLPVHAVPEVNGKKFCYVKADGEIEKRTLITGLTNNKFIEIKEGSDLEEGELVVQNPRSLAEKLGHLHADYQDPGEGMTLDGKFGKRSNDTAKQQPAEQPKPNPEAPGRGGTPAAENTPAGEARDGRPQLSQEELAKRKQGMNERMERFRKATPAERKAMLEEVPEQYRSKVKDYLKAQGMDVSE